MPTARSSPTPTSSATPSRCACASTTTAPTEPTCAAPTPARPRGPARRPVRRRHPEAAAAGRLRQGRGRRPRRRRRLPARAGPHGHLGDRLGLGREIQAPNGFSIDKVIQTDARSTRQLGRPAAGRARARDRRQLADRHGGQPGQRRHRLRGALQHRARAVVPQLQQGSRFAGRGSASPPARAPAARAARSSARSPPAGLPDRAGLVELGARRGGRRHHRRSTAGPCARPTTSLRHQRPRARRRGRRRGHARRRPPHGADRARERPRARRDGRRQLRLAGLLLGSCSSHWPSCSTSARAGRAAAARPSRVRR